MDLHQIVDSECVPMPQLHIRPRRRMWCGGNMGPATANSSDFVVDDRTVIFPHSPGNRRSSTTTLCCSAVE